MDGARVRRRLREEEARLERLVEETRRALGGPDRDGGERDPLDHGRIEMDRAQELAILGQVEGELLDVRAALEKLAAGTYGTCEACGRTIPGERLTARPGARFCIEDQRRTERLGSRVA
ncbi:MAG TPA: TraR/DksA C4-type zinc finger protein [Actinomycetota bacterium]|nr:TraR/DksA C4-type zinc finger protein [Actinomycetota bacterium]